MNLRREGHGHRHRHSDYSNVRVLKFAQIVYFKAFSVIMSYQEI